MTISLLHDFVSLKGDGTDPTKVQPSNWNEEHVLEQAANTVLGRASPGAGPTEELPAGALGRAILSAADITALQALFGMFTTGDAKMTFKAAADPGWVLVNDGSIGKSGSGATTRANDDTLDLYTLLYTNIPDTWAPVSGGRAAGAVGDFNSGKLLTIPKLLGRALVVAGAGAGLTNRVLGAVAGDEAVTLTRANLPNTNVPVTITDPGHTHSTTSPGAVAPSGTTVNHTYGATTGTSGSSVTGISAAFNLNGNVTQTTVANVQPSSFLNIMIKL